MAKEKIQKLDCLGEMCPVPLLRLKKALKSMNKGQSIKLITDHSCTQRSVYDYCGMYDLEMTVEEVITGVWEITVTKS